MHNITVIHWIKTDSLRKYILLLGILAVLIIPQGVFGGTTGTAVISGNIFQSPVAQFTADITNGSAPLVVQFSDQSDYDPASWNWDFGDGTSSTDRNPTHTYANGIYTVNLTVTNSAGSSTKISDNYITAYASKQTLVYGNNTGMTGTDVASLNISEFTTEGGTYTLSGTTLTMTYPASSAFRQMTITMDSVDNSNGNIAGPVNTVLLESTPITGTLPSTGESEIHTLKLWLNAVPPAGAEIRTTIIEGTDLESQKKFQAFASSGDLDLLDTRYELVVSTEIPYSTITGAEIIMEVPASWYNTYSSKTVKILRIDNAGSVSMLDTTISGFSGTYAICTGQSPGLSTFAITALQDSAVPSPSPSSPVSVSSGGGGSSNGGSGSPGPSAGPERSGQRAPHAASAVTPVNGTGSLSGTPLTADLVGMPGVTVSWTTRINYNPAPDARITTAILKNADPSTLNAFTTELHRAGRDIGSLAYIMVVQKTGITSTGPATVSMTAPRDWVTRNGGIDAIQIIRMGDDGMTESLATSFGRYDPTSGYLIFTAASPHGLSTFGLVATKPYTPSAAPAVTVSGQMAPVQGPAPATTDTESPGAPLRMAIAGVFAAIVITGIAYLVYNRKRK